MPIAFNLINAWKKKHPSETDKRTLTQIMLNL